MDPPASLGESPFEPSPLLAGRQEKDSEADFTKDDWVDGYFTLMLSKPLDNRCDRVW